jgi:hypothetical protein
LEGAGAGRESLKFSENTADDKMHQERNPMKNLTKSLPWLALLALALISVPRSANTAPPPPEPHPHIHAAIGELREAQGELRTAAHDFCGHRKEALEATNRALKQLQLALDCAK